MKQYLDLLKRVYDNGIITEDRTGVGRKRIFGSMVRFDLRQGFPLVTTKKVNYNAIIEELLWFIRGSSDVKELNKVNVSIWDAWKVQETHVEAFIDKYHPEYKGAHRDHLKREYERYFTGSIGPLYGHSWRIADGGQRHTQSNNHRFEDIASDKITLLKAKYAEALEQHVIKNDALKEVGKPTEDDILSFEEFAVDASYMHVDQLQNIITGLKKRPYSSRHVINAWIPGNLPDEDLSPQENVLLGKAALAPCHVMQQYFAIPGKDKPLLSLKIDIRSNDLPIGAPYNIAQYALLLHMVAHVTNMEACELIWTVGDAHIYVNQLPLIAKQLNREPYPLPKLILNPCVMDIYQFTAADIEIANYSHHPFIKYPVST